MSSILPVAKQFILHTKLFNNVLEGITDEQAYERINIHTNHLRWIAGHLTNIRYNVAALAGIQKTFPYQDIYVDKTQPPPHNRMLDTSLQYPSINDIKTHWNEISSIFTDAVSNLTEERLAMKVPFTVPTGDTFVDALSFMSSHEAYHIGQMSIIRRYLGLGAMSYM